MLLKTSLEAVLCNCHLIACSMGFAIVTCAIYEELGLRVEKVDGKNSQGFPLDSFKACWKGAEVARCLDTLQVDGFRLLFANSIENKIVYTLER